MAKARTGAELSALIGAAPTPAPAPSWRAIAKGAGVKAKRASATLTSTISDAVVQVSACGSANDPARQTALMSDAMASDWFTARGYTSDLLAGAVQTTPAQLPPQSWDAFASIDHIYTLGRDRASARVAFAPLSPALEPRVETHIFVKETSGWKLDAIRSLDAATASAKSGSLLARIFDCPAGVSADDPSANCEPTPELTFDYEIASADGSVRKSAADANFIGAGLLLWKKPAARALPDPCDHAGDPRSIRRDERRTIDRGRRNGNPVDGRRAARPRRHLPPADGADRGDLASSRRCRLPAVQPQGPPAANLHPRLPALFELPVGAACGRRLDFQLSDDVPR